MQIKPNRSSLTLASLERAQSLRLTERPTAASTPSVLVPSTEPTLTLSSLERAQSALRFAKAA